MIRDALDEIAIARAAASLRVEALERIAALEGNSA
jgi:hypothetical protein